MSPEYRRQGIGRRLMERLVELATELGCTEAWVLTDADNAAVALAMGSTTEAVFTIWTRPGQPGKTAASEGALS